MGCLKIAYYRHLEEPLFPSPLRVVHSAYRENTVCSEGLSEQNVTLVIWRVELDENGRKIRVEGYVMNNPLRYTDESGEFWNLILGAGISVVTNGFGNLAHGQSFFHGAGRAALIGAFGGAFSTGIGNAAGEIGKGFGRTAFQTAAHGFLGGAMSVANDESFGSGFLSGGFGSLAGSGLSGLLRNSGGFAMAAGTTLGGGLIGGISAEISGGSFWDGARNGAISAGLNHAAHVIQNRMLLNSYAKKMFGDDYKSKYGVKSLKWGSQMGKEVEGATYNRKDQRIYLNDDPSAGITTSDRRIYISDGIKAYGMNMLEATVGHELIHSYQRMTFGSSYNQGYSEYSAYQYSINFSLQHNFAPIQTNFFRSQQSTYPKSPATYDYRKIPGF